MLLSMCVCAHVGGSRFLSTLIGLLWWVSEICDSSGEEFVNYNERQLGIKCRDILAGKKLRVRVNTIRNKFGFISRHKKIV